MSAFVCSKRHIASIVLFYQRQRRIEPPMDNEVALTLANQLMVKNVASVNYRYKENSEPEQITESDLFSAKQLTPVECLKAIDCLDYQSCELPDWYDSKEKELLCQIQSVAIYRLPGYDDASWEVSEQPHRGAERK